MNLFSMSWIIPKHTNLKLYFQEHIHWNYVLKVVQIYLNFKQFQN